MRNHLVVITLALVLALVLGLTTSRSDERVLSRGVDLEAAPPVQPAQHARTQKSQKTVDLGSDRGAVKLSLPEPPRGAAATFTTSDGRRGWLTRIPEAGQLPAAAFGDGRVYVSSGFGATRVYALDASDGRIAWASTVPDGGPTAPIFIQQGQKERIAVNTYSCTLFVFDATSGKLMWSKYIGVPTVAQASIEGNLVYASHPGAGAWQLTAYGLDDGKEVWSAATDNELLAAPVVHGDSIYAATAGGRLYRFDRATGTQFWMQQLAATSAPWAAGDELFLSRKDGDREVQVVLSAATGKLLRSHHAVKGDYLGDVPTAANQQLWAFEGSRPVVAGGVRYEAMGGVIQASDPVSGDAFWTRRFAPAEHQRSVGTVALAGTQLVVATRTGDLYGLDVDTGYTTWAYGTGKAIVAQPIVASGWVYATTTDGEIIGLEVGDTTLDGWHMWGGNARHN